MKSIGIIGGGFVGSAVRRYFLDQGHNVYTYDKFKQVDPLEKVLETDYIFIAVPTPYKDGIDLSAVEDAMVQATKASEGSAIIIKSTVIPGTTEKFQKLYPHLKLLFNPEFLTELSAEKDFAKPDRQIVGFTKQSQDAAKELMDILPKAPYAKLVDATSAEFIKYFGNNWLAIKVAYANQMYDLCQKLGINYDDVKEGASADPRIGPSHLDVWSGGYRGYGGKCLPKDNRAMIKFAEGLGVDLKLHKIAEEINNELHKKQNLDIP